MAASESTQRLQALRKLLSQGKLSTQDELREELEDLKFKVTQSTVSRDLRRLGAVKATDSNGRTVYRLHDEQAAAPPHAARLSELILDMKHNGTLIVIHTSPGSASLIARHIDHVKPGGVLGTIAGDDTIFVAPPATKSLHNVIKAIEDSFQYEV
jgi:transcriptional regulator of arginine metabolism